MAKQKLSKKVNSEVQAFLDLLTEADLKWEKALVFGSNAKGTADADSDVDICIVSDQFEDSVQALSYLWRKRAMLKGSRVEPVGFTTNEFRDMTDPLVVEISNSGIVV